MTPLLEGSVLYGADELVATMVATRIKHFNGQGFGPRDPATGLLPYAALGVVRSGKLLGGVVFVLRGSHVMEMSGAFDRADWIRPATLRRLFAYPFIQTGMANLITITGRKNERARKLDKFLGFREVGTIHKGLDGRDDSVVYEMLREDCRWLKQPERLAA